MSELRPKLVGARVKRVEDPRLLTGHGSFTDDRRASRMLHVAFRRSEHSHARIASIDARAAAKLPGVIGVFTAADLETAMKPVRAPSRMSTYQATEMHALAKDKVRYVGEPIVAVVAENRYLAEDALEAMDIEFDALPTVIDPEAAILPDAPLLHDALGSNVLLAREFTRGDVETALAEAPVRVRARLRFSRKSPLAIENRTYLAEYDEGRGALTLYSSTQVPGILRDALAEIFDMPGHRLRVIAADVGGGFGGKGSLYAEEIVVCALARRLGRPVKFTSDRLEDLATTSQGFDEIVEGELGLDTEGRILALRADVIGDVGAYSIYPWTAALEPVQVISFLPGPYKIPAYRGRVQAVATSKAPTGPYRGVGRPVSTFVTERLLDMAARELAIDPVEIRQRNFVGKDEFPYKTSSGIVWDQASFSECLARARDEIGYEAFRKEQVEARAAGRLLGIGFASYAELTGIGSRISAAPGMPINTGTEISTVKIDSTGSVTAAFGIASHGQGLETTLAQVIADELGARFEDVHVIQGDSAAVAHSTGTYASRSAVLAGGAATMAAQALREKVVRLASHLLEASPGDIHVDNGRIFVAGTDRGMTFKQLARAVYSEMGRIPMELREDLEATKQYDPVFGTTTSATHVAVVEIDPATYQVKPLSYVVVEDCGKIINPLIVDGQVHGGVAQGIGAALFEKVVYDDRGQLLTASLVDYVVPAASEIPPMQVFHLETESPSTVGGFRGMGEGGTIGAPAAIANAVSDALAQFGVEVTELPVTPEQIFQAVRAANSQERK
ncbi:MAG TPA: xanthine dehydrogenase family protein molybdopterin-binding subunit [Xanthobacteraceae bacterium]|nr:xanthine dehydrogenase family protein molybdopterin-binding subunit [Xanthobacteraceae bacterium]